MRHRLLHVLARSMARGLGPARLEDTSLLWQVSARVLGACRRAATAVAEPAAGAVRGSVLVRLTGRVGGLALRLGRSSAVARLLGTLVSDLGGGE